MDKERVIKKETTNSFGLTTTKFTKHVRNEKEWEQFSRGRKHITNDSSKTQFVSAVNVIIPNILPREDRGSFFYKTMGIVSEVSTFSSKDPFFGGRPKEAFGVGT